MKNLIFLFVLVFFGLNSYCQTMTEKYNSYSGRYEYFNSNGTMVGYKVWDSYASAWKYYDVKQQDNGVADHAREMGRGQAQMQARYDYNYERLTTCITNLTEGVKNSPNSSYVKTNSLSDFQTKCLKYLDTKVKVNLTDNSQTTQIINWLTTSMGDLVRFYKQKEAE